MLIEWLAPYWCVLFGHDWYGSMVRGDYGEMGAETCSRCRLEQPQANMPCRCLRKWDGGCKCEFPVFVFDDPQTS